MLLLLLGEFMPGGDAIPFGETAATAGRGGVLGDKDRVAAHRGLLAIIFRYGGGQTFDDKITGVIQHRVEPTLFQILPLLASQLEPTPKPRLCEARKDKIEVTHRLAHCAHIHDQGYAQEIDHNGLRSIPWNDYLQRGGEPYVLVRLE